MAGAFQSDAFQNDAFQTESGGVTVLTVAEAYLVVGDYVELMVANNNFEMGHASDASSQTSTSFHRLGS